MHYGCRLMFDPEGYLLASIGDRFEPRVRIRAQHLDSPFGKILRLDRDGGAAPGNPFADTPGALPEIWAIGFRHTQGMTRDPGTGLLWSTDHGARGGDELNLLVPGVNYGWPEVAYGQEYERIPIGEGITQRDGTNQPVYYWDPAVAPSGLTFYSGKEVAEWAGDLFVATLRGKHLVRLKIKDNKVMGEERLLEGLEQRIRGVKEGPDGLYFWTDEGESGIFRIHLPPTPF